MDKPAKISGVIPHITVSMSSTYSDEWKSLRCSVCGNIVCQYNEDYIRSITPSGSPQLQRPGKIVQCSGVFTMYQPKDTFDTIYELLETIMQAQDVTTIRTKAIELAKDNHKTSMMCKARYYLG